MILLLHFSTKLKYFDVEAPARGLKHVQEYNTSSLCISGIVTSYFQMKKIKYLLTYNF